MGTAVKSFTAYLPESANYIDMALVRGIFHAVQKRISFPVNAHFFTFPMIGYLYVQVPFARFRHIDNFFRPAVWLRTFLLIRGSPDTRALCVSGGEH